MGIIELTGWLGLLLIVGAFFLNINGKVKSTSVPYILCNLIGGILFFIYTFVHRTYPNIVANLVWIIIAIAALMKKR